MCYMLCVRSIQYLHASKFCLRCSVKYTFHKSKCQEPKHKKSTMNLLMLIFLRHIEEGGNYKQCREEKNGKGEDVAKFSFFCLL